MAALVYIGVALAALGVGLLALCIHRARGLRGETDPEAVQAGLARLLPLNAAGVGLGFLGLALLTAGVIL